MRGLDAALAASLLLFLGACGSAPSSDTVSPSSVANSYIYVASGTTYAGNSVTTATPSNTVVRYNVDGTFDRMIADYTYSPGDSPVGLADFDSSTLLVLVDNASGRRIDRVAKDGSSVSTFLTNSTALSATLRSFFVSYDGGLLVSKGTAVEKFSSSKARILQGASPYINAPAGTCATTTTLITSVREGPGHVIIYSHAAASPNNRLVMISSTGYASAADCIAGVAGPTVNHYPTALLMHSSGFLFASYGNNTGPVHEVYAYPVTSTSFGTGTSAYSNLSVLQGISAMAELPDSTVVAASAASTFNVIERFSVSPDTGVWTRIGTTSFIPASIYTKSVSSILVAQ